jgi:hypothetical protein
MYTAKRQHKGSYVVWHPSLRMDVGHGQHAPDPEHGRASTASEAVAR